MTGREVPHREYNCLDYFFFILSRWSKQGSGTDSETECEEVQYNHRVNYRDDILLLKKYPYRLGQFLDEPRCSFYLSIFTFSVLFCS